MEDILHRLAGPQARPDGIFLAFGLDGDVAGVCWTSIDPERNALRGEQAGHIDSLAVVPEHRRRGLGRALLLAGMRWLQAQGQTSIELEAMGNNELALPLYEQVGFAIVRQASQYRRDLEELTA
jgi:mycothiol synthase